MTIRLKLLSLNVIYVEIGLDKGTFTTPNPVGLKKYTWSLNCENPGTFFKRVVSSSGNSII
jgi:hypothetical protein